MLAIISGGRKFWIKTVKGTNIFSPIKYLGYLETWYQKTLNTVLLLGENIAKPPASLDS
jgi:hypothetical protein